MTTGFVEESTLVRSRGASSLRLATAGAATPQGLVEHPTFFTGFVAHPQVAAVGILSVADVAGERYADAGLAQRLRQLDPVVTASGDRLRFESFSACNGVYARLDLLPEGLAGAQVGHGTTNVDVNRPLREALARVSAGESLRLTVGPGDLEVESAAGRHVERKVSMPDRWVRGLAEVPALSARLVHRGGLAAGGARTLLAALPRTQPPGPDLHVLLRGGTARLLPRALPGTTRVAGGSRLRGFARLARFATSLDWYADDAGRTGWVLGLPGARLTLLVSADPFHGISGEGTLLTLLADDDAATYGEAVAAHLRWEPRVDVSRLCERTGLPEGAVDAGLAWLAASGRVGHDLVEGALFHRDLPVDVEKIQRRHPRLRSAHRLVETGGVAVAPGGWLVRTSDGETHHHVHDEPRLRCDCTWEEKHHGSRGPCQHVLAVILLSRLPRDDQPRIDAACLPAAAAARNDAGSSW